MFILGTPPLRTMPQAKAAQPESVGDTTPVKKLKAKKIQATNWGPFMDGMTSGLTCRPPKSGLY